jgi:hypothetical protein
MNRELVRIVKKFGEIEFREAIEWPPRNFLKQATDYVLRFRLNRRMLFEDLFLGKRKQAIEAPEDGERQNDLAILVPFVWPAEQITDTPDEVGKLRMCFNGH